MLAILSAHCDELNHIHVANLWNKLGKQHDIKDTRHHSQLLRLTRRTTEIIESCKARELANIANGVARCRLGESAADALYAAVAEAAVSSGLSGFNPQNLANTAWAFATAGVRADALYAAVAEAAVSNGLRGFNPQELSNTAWAFATAGVRADMLYAAVAEAAVSSGFRGFKPQNLANTAWAFATACVFHPSLFATTTSLCQQGHSTLDEAELAQLHQVHLFLTLECPAGPAHTHTLHTDPFFRERCRKAMQRGVHVSWLQQSVGRQLIHLHAGIEMEFVEPRTGYSLDFAVPASRLAVEVDGPSHFMRGNRGEHVVNGTTLLKQRLLRTVGWCVVSIPYFEWDSIASDVHAQREYLRASCRGVLL